MTKPKPANSIKYEDIKPNGQVTFHLHYYGILRDLKDIDDRIRRMAARYKADMEEKNKPES